MIPAVPAEASTSPLSLWERARVRAPGQWLLSPPVVLVSAIVALLALVPAAGEFPINDDWLYARAVQSLVERGQLWLPPWGASSFVLQALWGGLFAGLFGFSHTALRLSTLVLSVAGVLGFYILLRD